ncbi:MAG: hypothetical protein U5J63_04300 [Fodinibius sp.]|nr:hypothetical protein [Fodinibius sp.]
MVGFIGHMSLDLNLVDNLNLKPGVSVGVYRQTIVGISDERDFGSAFRAWLPSPL